MSAIRNTRRIYPFPQADSYLRVHDVLDIVLRGPVDDAEMAEQLGISTRQGRYYADAAGYLGLVRLSGGYWRPEVPGRDMAALGTLDEKNAFLADRIVAMPVFKDVYDHIVETGVQPDGIEVLKMVGRDAYELNAVTSERRARTVMAWVEFALATKRPAIAEDEPSCFRMAG